MCEGDYQIFGVLKGSKMQIEIHIMSALGGQLISKEYHRYAFQYTRRAKMMKIEDWHRRIVIHRIMNRLSNLSIRRIQGIPGDPLPHHVLTGDQVLTMSEA